MALVLRGDRSVVPYVKRRKQKDRGKTSQLSTSERVDRALVAAGNAFQLSKTIYNYLSKFRPSKKMGGISEGIPPSAYNLTVANTTPFVNTIKSGAAVEGIISVAHREYVGSYALGTGGYGSTFRLVEFINPSNFALFPWLSGIANSYEQYKFTKFNVCIVPTCPTSTSGKVVVSIDPDSADADPTSIGDVLNGKYAQVAAPWEPQVLSYKPCGQWRYVNGGTQSDVTRLINDGKLFVNGIGSTLADAFDVIVEYQVQLKQPQVVPTDTQLYDLTSGGTTMRFLDGSIVTGPRFTYNNVGEYGIFFKKTGYYIINIVLVGTALIPTSVTSGSDVAYREASLVNPGATIALWVLGVYVNSLGSAWISPNFTKTTLTGGSVAISRITADQYLQIV